MFNKKKKGYTQKCNKLPWNAYKTKSKTTKEQGLRNKEGFNRVVLLKTHTCTKSHLHNPGNSLFIHTTLVKRAISAWEQPAYLLQAPSSHKRQKEKEIKQTIKPQVTPANVLPQNKSNKGKKNIIKYQTKFLTAKQTLIMQQA